MADILLRSTAMARLVALIAVLWLKEIRGHDACDFPVKFEGHMSTQRTLFYSNDTPAFVEEHEEVRFGYDAVNERSYKQIYFTSGNKTKETVILTFAKKNTTYSIHDGKCEKSPSGHWIILGVPAGSTNVGSYYLGLDSNATITVYRLPHGEIHLPDIHIQVTSGCVPVIIKQDAMLNTGGFMTISTFKNITLGLKDESVFKVPEICAKAAAKIEPLVSMLEPMWLN